jgi:hypothetical protein
VKDAVLPDVKLENPGYKSQNPETGKAYKIRMIWQLWKDSSRKKIIPHEKQAFFSNE